MYTLRRRMKWGYTENTARNGLWLACMAGPMRSGVFLKCRAVRLQARTMGIYAAHVMAGLEDEFASGFAAMELFTHVTR